MSKAQYKEYLKGDWWKDRRKKYWTVHEKKCYCCGSKNNVQIHHKNYSRKGMEQDKDLVPLCKKCHKVTHELVKKYKSKLKKAHILLKKHYDNGFDIHNEDIIKKLNYDKKNESYNEIQKSEKDFYLNRERIRAKNNLIN